MLNHRCSFRAALPLSLLLASLPAVGQSIATVAGGGPVGAGFYLPAPEAARGLVTDADGLRAWRIGAAEGAVSLANPLIAGDGSPATSVAFVTPSGVAYHPNGDLYIVDTAAHAVRRVDHLTGLISTVAGDGTAGFSGDGGPAAQARLSAPTAAIADFLGNLYVSDTGNHRVRLIDTNGRISTFAGTGTAGTAGENGPATAAQLSAPRGLAFDDKGNLYVADAGTHIVRVIQARTNIFSTVAGSGVKGFSGDGLAPDRANLDTPVALAFDSSQNLFISDQGNHRIRKVSPTAGTITTFAGDGEKGFAGDGGPADSASLNVPAGIATEGEALIIADSGNHRLRRVDNGVIRTILGNGTPGFVGDNGPATAALINAPLDVAFAPGSGHMTLADTGNARARTVFRCILVSPPQLGLPLDGAQNVPLATELDWGGIDGAFGYDVFLYTTSAPARALALNYNGTSIPVTNLLPNTTYSWRVVARGDRYCSPLSLAPSFIHSFKTGTACGAPATFAEVAPTEGATVPSDTTISWQASAGAASYDLYLGATNPPPLYAKDLTAASRAVTGLSAETRYYWRVVAHASCDASRTTNSPLRTFVVSGTCAPVGSFVISSFATNDPAGVRFNWSAAPGAAAYDLYLGTDANPPLFLRDLPGLTAVFNGYETGSTYRARVVAKSACSAATASSQTVSFSFSTCHPPEAPSFVSGPAGSLQVGQTYALTFSTAGQLEQGGSYVVERSTSATFATVLDQQTSATTAVAFVAPAAGTLYHRVRGIPACDAAKAGAFSETRAITVVASKGNVVVGVAPQAISVALNGRLEDKSTSFTLQNIGGSPITLRLSTLALGDAPPFFSVVDRNGGNPAALTFNAGQLRTLDVRFAGPSTSSVAALAGLITAATVSGEPLASAPYVFVNLTIGGATSSGRQPLAGEEAPLFQVNGDPTELVAFPPLSGDDNGRAPITVEIRNPGTVPLQLGAEVGPEAWLVPEPGWNATPLAAGAVRSVKLSTQRSLAPHGSAFPRHTYFIVRTPSGKTARLLVEDVESSLLGTGRTALPDRGTRSYVVPSVANVGAAVGGRFVSRLTLSNAGSDAVQAELIFTPSNADGFDASLVKNAIVVVPANDVVALNDPLVKTLGLAPGAFGHLEVRAAPSRIGFLTVTSAVDAPQPSGGSFGFQLPTVQRGEGARAGIGHLIPGINQGSQYRTNLILAETSGVDHAAVRVTLYDKSGQKTGDTLVDVPRYGQKQVNRVVETLNGSVPFSAGRLELVVESGGGSVAGVITVIDNKSNDSVTYVSRPMLVDTPGRRPQASAPLSLVVPAIVNGFPTFRGRDDLPYRFRSLMGFSSTSLTPATYTVRYADRVTGEVTTKTVTVPPRQTLEYENVVNELFGIDVTARSEGPVFLDASPNGTLYCKVYSDTENGTLGDGFPLVVIPSEILTGVAAGKPVSVDGVDQSADITRGTRSNLILNEVKGQPAKVVVRLYEAGNRTVPVAEREFQLAPLEKLQLSTLFSGLGLETEATKKDRSNVLVVITPSGGAGAVSAVVTTIDNKTGDTKNSVLTPAGGTLATGTGSIGF